jgi:SAM-dependent methyltransferase
LGLKNILSKEKMMAMMMKRNVHKIAATGFNADGSRYDKARPSYPKEMFGWLSDIGVLRRGLGAVDVGAGTGIFTRELAAHVGDSEQPVLAVEPVSGMREMCSLLPNVVSADGSAESLPVEDGSVDLITVAQAFHWFASATSLNEFRRALAPGGALVLVWNLHDDRVEWVRRLRALFEAYEGDDAPPQYRHNVWRQCLETDTNECFAMPFAAERSFDNAVTDASAERIIDDVLSRSYIASRSKPERRDIAEQVAELLRNEHGDTDWRINVPYRTDVFVLRPILNQCVYLSH